ncbi:MAG: EAL domain-containing protein [Pseudomonadota bacterium]
MTQNIKDKPVNQATRRPAPHFGSRTALQAVSDGVVVVSARGTVEFLNPAAEALSGWGLDEATNQPVDAVVSLHDDAEGLTLDNLLSDGPTQMDFGRCTMTTRTGDIKCIDANVSPVINQDGTITGKVLVLKDRSEEKGLQARLDHQSTHDALTGLLNRKAFEQKLSDLFSDNIATTEEHALLYLDLDQFKIINDTCGHAAGDHYLLQLTQLLQKRVRNSDVLARLGGDEFGVLLHGCNEEQAKELAGELCESVAAMNFSWRERIHRHTVSIGIIAIEPADDAAAVLSAADVACFTAKDMGRNRLHVYHDDKVPNRHVEMQWVARISRALDEERLVVYSQPIVNIGSETDNDIPHYELLVRLTDRFGQVIVPQYFISAAERYNLMPRVDAWMVSHVLKHLVWRPDCADCGPRYKLSLNLSGTSLSDGGFMDHLEALFDEHSLAPGTLCFEITETATITNMAQVAQFMHRMKARGCEFSLDDFGSGLSSFAYLKELPVDLLKIDGDFVADILTSPSDAAVVDAITRVGKAMGIRTVAERVENQALLDALISIGVDFAQGFYFARPRPVRNRSSFNGVTTYRNSALA